MTDTQVTEESKQQETPKGEVFKEATRRLIERIEAIRGVLPLVMLFIEQTASINQKDFEQVIARDDVKLINETSNNRTYELGIGSIHQFREVTSVKSLLGVAKSVLPTSVFVTLISEFDAFAASIMRGMFNTRPEILNSVNSQISYSQLREFGTIEKAEEYLVASEIETIFRGSHADLFSWFKQKTKIDIASIIGVWPQFIEITERRHLFVHCEGIVSKQYIENCKNAGHKLDEKIVIGKRLGVTRPYFEEACDTIIEVGVKLSQIIWRHLISEEKGSSEKALINTTLNIIRENNHKLAARILEFALHNEKEISEESNKLLFALNLAQAYKWMGNSEQCNKCLEKIEWKTKHDFFQFGSLILKDNFVDAATLMPSLTSSERVPQAAFADWPIFREFIKSQAFHDAYEKCFGEKFSDIESVSAVPPNEIDDTETNSESSQAHSNENPEKLSNNGKHIDFAEVDNQAPETSELAGERQ